MNVKDYIESGVLELYCMGLLNEEEQAFVSQMSFLYPEVSEELSVVALFMERLYESGAVDVIDPDLKEKVLKSLDFSSVNGLDPDNLPVIDQDTDYRLWLNSFRHLIPAEPTRDMMMKSLRKDNKVIQTLIVTKIDVPEEVHTDVNESFLILYGECECTLGDHVFKAGPGSFVAMPLHVKHNVRVLSPVVVAVLQYQML